MIGLNLIRAELSLPATALAQRRYALRYPEKVRAKNQARQSRLTPEERKVRAAYAREWRKAHPGYCAAQSQKWKKAHPEEFKALCSRWDKTPKGRETRRALGRGEKAKATKAVWKAKNPDVVKAIEHRRNHTRRARLYSVARAPYDFAEILLRSENRCAYQLTGCLWLKDQKIQLTADHVVPISKGGGDVFENVLPACDSCNKRKGTRLIEPRFRVVQLDCNGEIGQKKE